MADSLQACLHGIRDSWSTHLNTSSNTPLFGLMQDVPLLISSLIQYAASYHGTREIVSQSGQEALHRYTYADAYKRVGKLAHGLNSLGIKTSDRIATLAGNTHRHFELFYGVSGIGAVLHTVNPRLFEDQVVYIINHAEDTLLFLDPDHLPLAEKLASRLPTIQRYIVLCDKADMPETGLSKALCYEDLLGDEPTDYPWPVFDENLASSLCYTSGTTGDPKGVLYSHRSTVLHALGAAQVGAMALGPKDCILPIAPMYHANAWAMPYIAPMVGAKLVLPGAKMDPVSLLSLINEEHVSFACAVPTVWTMLLEHLDKTNASIPSLNRTTIGGSAVPMAMIDRFRDKYGVEVLQLWGMTEISPLGTLASATPVVDTLSKSERADVLSKQGRVMYGLELKIVDPSGNSIPQDGETSGDLWVRGGWAAKGYYKRENETHLDDQGWFPTGDVATLDPYGYMKITDRTKDVIKSGGEWISSIDLENAAVGHAKVSQAAVIGVHHPKWEERPLMLVVPVAEETIEPDEVLAFLQKKVAKWWLPDEIHIVDELPLTATGKIKKAAIRETYKDFSFI